jgi:hypothetical protein
MPRPSSSWACWSASGAAPRPSERLPRSRARGSQTALLDLADMAASTPCLVSHVPIRAHSSLQHSERDHGGHTRRPSIAIRGPRWLLRPDRCRGASGRHCRAGLQAGRSDGHPGGQRLPVIRESGQGQLRGQIRAGNTHPAAGSSLGIGAWRGDTRGPSPRTFSSSGTNALGRAGSSLIVRAGVSNGPGPAAMAGPIRNLRIRSRDACRPGARAVGEPRISPRPTPT